MEPNIIVRTSLVRRYYENSFQELLEKFGLTRLEAVILIFLHNNPDFNTARDIVELRGFSKSNVSTALEALRLRQYLTVRPDPDSRRVRRIFLREEKRDVVEALARRQQETLGRLTDGFSPEELAEMQRFLDRMEENIKHYGL